MWTMTFSIVDSKNAKSTFTLNFPLERTVAQLEAFATALGLPLAGMIKGGVTAINIARSMALPLLMPKIPQEGGDFEEGARFTMRSATGNTTSVRIPTINENIIQTNSRAVNLGISAVQAFLSLFEDGLSVGGTVVTPTDNRGSAVVLVTDAYESFSSSRGKK